MSKFKYYPKSHKYKIGKKELISVTTFVGKFFKPFKAKEVARKLAKFPINKQNKRGVRYWLNQWKESAEHGTRVHNAVEDIINGKDKPKLEEERDNKKVEQVEIFLKEEIEEDLVKDTELKIYSEELGLAGTIDLIIYNEDGTVSLVDWKTNKAIKKKGFSGEKCKAPLADMDDCNYNKYLLQLSTYAYILEKQYDLETRDLKIVHLKEDSYKIYEVEYMKDKVEEMLNEIQTNVSTK